MNPYSQGLHFTLEYLSSEYPTTDNMEYSINVHLCSDIRNLCPEDKAKFFNEVITTIKDKMMQEYIINHHWQDLI